MTAIKHDNKKPPMALIDPEFLEDMADGLAAGEAKYGEDNWRTGDGLRYSQLISASKRHIQAFEKGQEVDTETDLPHLALAACNLMMLASYGYEPHGPGIDDRRFAGAAGTTKATTESNNRKTPWGFPDVAMRFGCVYGAPITPIRSEAKDDPAAALADIVRRWADTVYPDRTPHSALSKLVIEEIPELLNGGLDDPLEWGDVIILAIDAAALRGIDLIDAGHRKMEINMRRNWAVDHQTGIMHHIKDGGQ